ncbi:MAG TPA: VCBS repeat-containing protein [Puia sp.]|nr:VCBS repeat-containing protein [Puia sp.]
MVVKIVLMPAARALIFGVGLSLVLSSCGERRRKDGLHFTSLEPSTTGVYFSNMITESDSLNMFVNEYTYMGGGVGIGDFNRDGLPDIFLAGNQVSSKLYLNKGGMHFEDVTAKAGLTTSSWCTGVSVVDINNDGWPDIYVCVSGRVAGAKRKNLLFINQHDLTFREQAEAYGLADTSYSTQAVFFDYDRDGRLDMYLLNHTLDDYHPNDIKDRKVDSNAVARDKLFHNDGVTAGMDHPFFQDVSRKAGIVEDGNGLGVVVSDVNGDGYADIYVANDYIRNDLLWLNNGDGTFSNTIASSLRHQSYSSMGADAADLNNDGLPDIMTLDMQPETNQRKKMMYSFLGEERRRLEVAKGYEPEYIHNMLQLNNGNRMIEGRRTPFFSEIGNMAGMAETDWSWSVLVADLDNDGWKDVHITNGLGRDPTNIDFLEYRHERVVQTNIPDSDQGQRRAFMERLSEMGPVKLRNYIFRNRGELRWEDVSLDAGITEPTLSNGAAYADLDNDGDLDLVTNNVNGVASVLRNDLRGEAAGGPATDTANFLTVRLRGDTLNPEGIGARVYTYSRGMSQVVEEYPVRGYLSSVDSRLHVGLGAAVPDSVKVVWPDGKRQVVVGPGVNKVLELRYADAMGSGVMPFSNQAGADAPGQPYFVEAAAALNTVFLHRETFFYDYAFQPLIQQKYSQEGPFISVGDVNGDGREDVFIGGAFRQSGKLFLQEGDGTFRGTDLTVGSKNEEDLGNLFFDADGDGDPDLLIAGGSTEFESNSWFCRPRLYLNDGKGNFKMDSTAFPSQVITPGKAVAVADLDGDGDMDVFVGGRVSLGVFPEPPRSFLLRNEHGKFQDVTDAVCPALKNPGLINAAFFADVDGDKRPDLILAGDWMPIRVFHNNGSTMTEVTAPYGLKNLPGFWRSIALADVNHDGFVDIVAGNLGSNNPFHISTERPAELVAKDFDGNGIVEPLFCYYIKDEESGYQLLPGISRDLWATQMPSIKKVYDRNELYAKAKMDDVFTKGMMEGATILDCREVRSGWFENDHKGRFSFHPFPSLAQIAPVNAIVCTDVDGDGNMDIILGGNEYQAAVTTGRYDASYGVLLKGDGHGGFRAMGPGESGLMFDGDVKDLKVVHSPAGRVLMVAVNDGPMEAYRISGGGK